MDEDDVEALQYMAAVGARATGSPEAAALVVDVPGLSGNVAAQLDVARAALAAYGSLGPTRFRLAKRVVLQASRPITHHVRVAAEALTRALADLAMLEAEQVGYWERLNSSLRALVVSTDQSVRAAVEDAADQVGIAAADGGHAVDRLLSEVALLQDRVALLEERLERAKDAAEPVAGRATTGIGAA